MDSTRQAGSFQVGSDSNGSISFEAGKGKDRNAAERLNEDQELIEYLLAERKEFIERLSYQNQ